MTIIPSGRVTAMLEDLKAHNNGTYEMATKTLAAIEDTLGDDLAKWYGAQVGSSIWSEWFRLLVLDRAGLSMDEAIEAKGENLGDALEPFKGVQPCMLLDAFINDHPTGQLAKMKYDKPKPQVDIDAAMRELEDFLNKLGVDPTAG